MYSPQLYLSVVWQTQRKVQLFKFMKHKEEFWSHSHMMKMWRET